MAAFVVCFRLYRRKGKHAVEMSDTSKESPAMRTIGIVACYALVIVLTLLVPASAQVLDFTTVDVPGASATLPRAHREYGEPRGGHLYQHRRLGGAEDGAAA